jgi:hypothetical protein
MVSQTSDLSQQEHEYSSRKTPSSNTGLNSQNLEEIPDGGLTVKVDWFQGTLKLYTREHHKELVDFIECGLVDKVKDEVGKGRFLGKQWANQATSARGAVVYYNFPGENGDAQGHALISFPGGAFANMPAGDVRDLISKLVCEFGVKPTRFDVAIDDYAKRITYEQVVKAIEAKNYARFRKGSYTKNFGDDNGGFTVYCGTPSSDRRLRFYDKNAESDGQTDSYRWEVQLRDEIAAKSVLGWLAEDEQLAAQHLGALVVGTVEFVERSTEKNVPRMTELSWWEAFKEAVGRSIRHSVQKVQTNLARARKWVNKSVAPTLAIMKRVFPDKFDEWLEAAINAAPKRFNDNHHAKELVWYCEYHAIDRELEEA